jgi:serine/threonine protein phosphatase PrpC
MEDAHAVHDMGKFAFFGVFDGHGGAHVAEACAQALHTNLGTILDRSEADSSADVRVAIMEAFLKTDMEMENAEETGTTAAVLVIVKGIDKYWVAHCGDSRITLVRSGGACESLTQDHHLSREDERCRILASDGYIINTHGDDRVMGDTEYVQVHRKSCVEAVWRGSNSGNGLCPEKGRRRVHFAGQRRLVFCDE